MCGEAGGIAKGTVGSRAKACTATALAVAGEQVEALRLRPRSGADSGASGVGGRSHSRGSLSSRRSAELVGKMAGMAPRSCLALNSYLSPSDGILGRCKACLVSIRQNAGIHHSIFSYIARNSSNAYGRHILHSLAF